MRSFRAFQADPSYLPNPPPALKSGIGAGNVYRVLHGLAPLAAYVGALALFAVAGIQAWNEFPADDAPAAARSAWIPATRSYPAFAITKTNNGDKTESYTIFRHADGGRKDVIRWGLPDQNPVAELELYRSGGEWSRTEPDMADLASRMTLASEHGSPMRELETAGIIETKFGPVKLLGPVPNAEHTSSCLGFVKRFDSPNLQMSGWSCQGETLPAKRAAISCLLNRLVLLTAGNEPKLAELFAHAELKRVSCSTSAAPPLSADWLTGMDNPRLRGLL